MKCAVCKRVLTDNDSVIPVLRYVENPKRGDWVTTNPKAFIHARHVLDGASAYAMNQPIGGV